MNRRKRRIYGGAFCVPIALSVASYLYCANSVEVRPWWAIYVMLGIFALGVPITSLIVRPIAERERGDAALQRTAISVSRRVAANAAACAAVYCAAYYVYASTGSIEWALALLFVTLLPTTAVFSRSCCSAPATLSEAQAPKKQAFIFAVLGLMLGVSVLVQFRSAHDVATAFHAAVTLLIFGAALMLAIEAPFVYARYRRARAL